MTHENLILVKHYCEHTKISNDFIASLQDYGFIQCHEIDTEVYVLVEDVGEIERVARLHYELGINLEGIDALNHLLKRMQHIENEAKMLRNRLRIYEDI